MTVSAEVLRELHRIHCQLAELNERLQRGPRQIKAREVNVVKFEADLTTAQESVMQTKKLSDQKQLDLKSGETKIADLKAKLNVCSSNKEYQSLLEQIAASEMANSVLADEILEAMEKGDQLEVAVGEAKVHLGSAQTELSKCRDSVATESELIRGDIARLEGELTDSEKQLPTEMRDDYRRVIRSKGADGMAVAEDGVCLACGNMATLNMHNELLLNKPVFCKACGCLLYIGEN
jgi:predicted  nucleic acid-binding Zn-ribbon protein